MGVGYMKKMLKLLAGIMLALFVVSGASASGKGDGNDTVVVGVLSFLNLSEENYASLREGEIAVNAILHEQGYIKSEGKRPDVGQKVTIRYFDTLGSLLMALKAGEIHAIGGISQTTAVYLCAQDPQLQMLFSYDWNKERKEGSFPYYAFQRLSSGFSFMMLEKNIDLRNQFNAVIAEMKKEGSLDKLIKEQILDSMDGRDLAPIVPEYKPGRETIKVAVTGALPPMDYVAPDGTFAGFNTALLAEIGRRLDKNVSMVQVSSVGRATALASGTVDVVFWTRSAAGGSAILSKEFEERMNKMKEGKPEKEVKAMDTFTAALAGKDGKNAQMASYGKDMPDGTIITEPYFMSTPAVVILKK